MPELYRVFPYLEGARPTEPGGSLYCPRHRQGQGRADHPDHYGVLYLAVHPLAAITERFQGFRGRSIGPRHLRVGPLGEGSVYALAAYQASAGSECDLDHPQPLAERGLVPSDIATHDRAITQAWALVVFRERRWMGVRYWSSLEAKWPVVARWDWSDLLVLEVEQLTTAHPAVREAADFLAVELESD